MFSNPVLSGPLDIGDFASTKVHIKGLDNLTTNNVRAFASEHYAVADPSRIEWIDDSSANILYESPEHASQALLSFTDTTQQDAGTIPPAQIRRAKILSTHPQSELVVRQAFMSDTKKPHARDASRFYLLNPDKDPRDRSSQYDSRRGQRGVNNRRGNDEGRYRRQKEEEEQTPFDVNMYDDDAGSLAARQTVKRVQHGPRSEHLSEEPERLRNSGSSTTHTGGDLFSDRLGGGDGRLRDRSASPSRIQDGDGRLGFDNGVTRGRNMRQRSRTPPHNSGLSSRSNAGKELLAPPAITKIKELFPGRLSPAVDATSAKELFPRKQSTGNHRRSAAFDAADVTGDLFAHRLVNTSSTSRSRGLADRISSRPGRNGVEAMEDDEIVEGFNIRGTAGQGTAGFSIRGGAGPVSVDPRTKELFPSKVTGGNTGKELFGAKTNRRDGLRV